MIFSRSGPSIRATSCGDISAYQAFRSLVDASDALRTTIILEDGAPRQRILDDFDAQIDVIDLASAEDPGAAYSNWLEERKRRVLRILSCCSLDLPHYTHTYIHILILMPWNYPY